MKIKIEFDLAVEESDFESQIEFVLSKISSKILNQLQRTSDCICTWPESDDLIKNNLGTTIGKIEVLED
jgi:hypothetical protein